MMVQRSQYSMKRILVVAALSLGLPGIAVARPLLKEGAEIVCARPAMQAASLSSSNHAGLPQRHYDLVALPQYAMSLSAGPSDRMAEASSYALALTGALGVPCEPNRLLSISATVPTDPNYSEQYGLQKIEVENAWDTTVGSRDIKVAVVDTGVQLNHPDLAANIASNSEEIPGNSIDDDNNGFVDDVAGWDFVTSDNDPTDENGHGTHCSGIVGAVPHNGIGGSGVNQVVSIVAVRVLDENGSGYLSDVGAGIDYAVDSRSVDIISLSLGGSSSSSVLQQAIARAGDAGVLVVAAAGNSASNNDTTATYPANYGKTLSNVIAVAATDSNDDLAYYSNYGATTVHLAAPGSDILSTVPTNSYDSYSGTSMATPHVAGVAALIKAAVPGLTALQIKSAILNGVDQLGALSGKTITGGRLNAYRSVLIALGEEVPANPSVELTLNVNKKGRQAILRGKVLSDSLAASNQSVRLVCTGRANRSTTSNSRGVYRFTISTPRRRTTCYTLAGSGRSPSRLVRR